MSVLVCLISDQRMQNVLPLFQKGLQVTKVIGLATGLDGRFNPKYENIWNCLKNNPGKNAEWELWNSPVRATYFEDTYEICKFIIKANGASNVVVNITGGTKPMAFGAYRAGLECGAYIIYTDTELEQFYWQSPNQSPEYLPFNLNQITVDQITQIQGQFPDDERGSSEQFMKLINSGDQLLKDRQQTLNSFNWLQRQMPPVDPENEFYLRKDNSKGSRWLVDLLEEHKLVTIHDQEVIIPKATIQFLRGKWLEVYTYLCLLSCDEFMNVKSPMALKGFNDELDAAVVFNGKLGLIECKTGNLSGRAGTDAINKLENYRSKLSGPFGQAFLITTSNQGLQHVQRRADASRPPITVVSGGDIVKVENIILTSMKASPK